MNKIIAVRFFLVVIFLVLASTAVAAPFAYISNTEDNTVSVIDTATNMVVDTVAVTEPFGVAVNATGTRVYVTSLLFSSVAVIDTATNTVVASIPVTLDPGLPTGVAVNSAGTRIYVAHSSSSGNTVSVIDAATNAVIDSVAVGIGPFGVAVNPTGTRVYVTNDADPNGTVSIIDASINAVIDTVAVGFNPRAVAVNPAGTRVYVGNATGNTVRVIDTASNTVIDTVTVGEWPFGIAVNPAGTRVYVTNLQSDSVSVIDTVTNSVVATVAVGIQPYGVAINPTGTSVYVANSGSDTVSVIDTATHTVVDTVTTGAVPIAFGRFIVPAIVPPITPFAAFEPRMILLRRNPGHDLFLAKGSFTLGEASDGIDPLTKPVAFSLADMDGTFFDQTLPPGSFQHIGQGGFLFRAPEGSSGVCLMILNPTKEAGRFIFQVFGKKLNLSEADNTPVMVSLQIGDDSGAETISCQNLSKVLICR